MEEDDYKEEEKGGWCSRTIRERYGIKILKAIRSGWAIFSSRISFKVDNG